MFGQKTFARFLAEFLGTGLLTLALYTIIARTTFPLFTGAAVGLTVALLIMIFGQVSGGHFNPAVTVAQWTRGHINTIDSIINIASQFLGAVAAWYLIQYFLGQDITSIAGKFSWNIFTAEAIGAGVFTFGIGAAVYSKVEASKFAAAIGLSLFLGVLVASLASNAVLNPAVALGIQSWNWAYAAAPIVGGIIGINLFNLVFAGDWSLFGRKLVPASVKKKTSTSSKAKSKSKSKRK